jgi:DNA-binding transcriptional LysR family regulator
MMAMLDISTVQAFLLVAELQSFTRAAEALGTTQAAVSMKLQRLEALLGKRLVERSPRAVRLTADGSNFLDHARALMEAHDRALSGELPARQQLSLGISDHAAGPELVALLARLHAVSPQLALSVAIGFSRKVLEAYDAGELDAVIVRQEGSRRGGEKLAEDDFGWSPRRDYNGVAASVCRWRRWRRPAACGRSPFAPSTEPASNGTRRLSAAA